jgi:hypothetical protein
MPPAPVLRPAEPVDPVEPMDEDVQQPIGQLHSALIVIPAVVPDLAVDKAYLVMGFREELIQDLVRFGLGNEMENQYRVSPHSLRQVQVKEAIRNQGSLNGRPYLLTENLTRHDWHKKTGECIYTINICDENGQQFRLSAEQLQKKFSGVPYSVWQYWGERTRVKDAHVHRYVHAFGRHDFYRAVMYFWLAPANWIELWRELREIPSSRRV